METLALPKTGIHLALAEIASDFTGSFDDLPHDDHLKSRFRFRLRRYSRCHYHVGTVEWLAALPFLQTAEHNHLAAGRPRQFHPLNSETRQHVARDLIPTLVSQLPGDQFVIGVHQIRIVANDEEMGKPAPEGIHRDGFDYVAVFAVARTNVNGGVTILVDLNDHHNILFEGTLERGEVILFDDRSVAHYTTPITPRYPGAASRDVFVVTFNMARPDCE